MLRIPHLRPLFQAIGVLVVDEVGGGGGGVWKLGLVENVLVMTFDGVVEVVAVSGSRPRRYLMMNRMLLLLLLVLWWRLWW